MKRFFLGTFLIFLSVGLVTAQEYKKQLKNANKALGKYYLDPVSNKADLAAALATLDQVFAAEDAKGDAEAWITKGQILNEIGKAEMNRKILDPKFELATPKAGMMAMEAFEMAMAKAIKKSQTKDALAGIKENEEVSNNIGITYFQAQDYNQAYANFAATLKANELLKANKMESRLDDPAAKNDQTFYTAVAGYFGDNKDASLPLFESLYKQGKAQPLVYEALFNMTADKNIDKAMEYLSAGREANPDDNGLLFAEINYYLKENKLDLLVDKLKMAIAKEPDNVSVYNTMGNVYDQLNQKERDGGNNAKADEYFNLAFDYFGQALSKDPKNFDATYSQGALYYNKAAGMVSKLNALSNDFTPAGTKKYNALKEEMDGYFKQALPYFLKAEELDPKDINTLIALKEVYARSGDFEKSNAYKAKMEAAGQK